MADKLSEKIEVIEVRLKALKAQQQLRDARIRAASSKKERSDETRRKIIVGNLVWGHMQINVRYKSEIIESLNKTLKRADDRKLFGLYPLSVTHIPQVC